MKILMMNDQLNLGKAGIRFRHHKDRVVFDGEDIDDVRIWRSNPSMFSIQLRKWGRTGETLRGKKRYMTATFDLTIADVERILEYMKGETV